MPGRLALAVFRCPLWLYRHDKGWLLGRTFLMLEHVGRKTAQRHQTVAMVLADNPETGELVIVSAWGPDADWLLNLRAGPATEVRVGHDRFAPKHRFLGDEEAVAVGKAFVHRHPRRLWLISTVFGWGDLRKDAVLTQFVQRHPLVGLSPLGS